MSPSLPSAGLQSPSVQTVASKKQTHTLAVTNLYSPSWTCAWTTLTRGWPFPAATWILWCHKMSPKIQKPNHKQQLPSSSSSWSQDPATCPVVPRGHLSRQRLSTCTSTLPGTVLLLPEPLGPFAWGVYWSSPSPLPSPLWDCRPAQTPPASQDPVCCHHLPMMGAWTKASS